MTSADKDVMDILRFFYPTNPPITLNDQLRQLAPVLLLDAVEGSSAFDMVPRPPAGPPTLGWLAMQAVQAFWRTKARTRLYETVRVAVALKRRSEYEMAKLGI